MTNLSARGMLPGVRVAAAFTAEEHALAGDHADATSDGGAKARDAAEPDLKDAASGPRQSDLDSTG